MSRVQKRFLTAAIFFHRNRRAIFERGNTGSAEGLGWNEPNCPFATLASYQYALTLYVVKECPLPWLADVREAEIIFVNQHLSAPPASNKLPVDRLACRKRSLDRTYRGVVLGR